MKQYHCARASIGHWLRLLCLHYAHANIGHMDATGFTFTLALEYVEAACFTRVLCICVGILWVTFVVGVFVVVFPCIERMLSIPCFSGSDFQRIGCALENA